MVTGIPGFAMNADEDLARARTPPAAFYTDPARLEQEFRTVLARSWQYVGHAGQLPRHGDYFTCQLGHEPLLFVNDAGTIRGYYNVCRHRAGPIAAGAGQAPRLVCRYHGWTYDLGGRLLRAPEMEGTQDFNIEAIRLAAVAVHRFGPLIFAALDPATPPFEDFHPRLDAACVPFRIERMRHVCRIDYPVDANWKLYIDNYLEGYHVPMVHPALNREIDYRSYVTELAPHRVLQHAPVRTDSATVYRQAAGEPNASYYWLYPNIMLNLYSGHQQVNAVLPDGVDRTVVRFDWFGPQAEPGHAERPEFRALLEFAEIVQVEDAAICASVHRNLRSSAYVSGPYSPVRETGVHYFHRLLRSM